MSTFFILVLLVVHASIHLLNAYKVYVTSGVRCDVGSGFRQRWRWPCLYNWSFCQFQWNSLKDSDVQCACVCVNQRQRGKSKKNTTIIFLIYLIALLLSLISSLCCLVYEYKYLWFLHSVSKCVCVCSMYVLYIRLSICLYSALVSHRFYHNIRCERSRYMYSYIYFPSSSATPTSSSRNCAHTLEMKLLA